METSTRTVQPNRAHHQDPSLDDEELMREVLRALVDDTSRQMRLLATAIQDQDATRCMHLAHYSEGACSSVGADTAAAILKDIERHASHHDFGPCRSALLRLADEVETLRSAAGSL